MISSWRLSEFDEVRVLGAGAQGRVVLARHRESGAPVAIKYLTSIGDERALERFRGEAVMLARVVDPHVARLYRLVEGDHGAAIVMEAIAGVSLKEVLAEHGALTPESALVVLKGSLSGLAAAHAAGVVHRDYKPANVVVQSDGTSKLVDFGVAALAGDAGRVGTPAYMAPEQWRGEPAGPSTDVYAATCVFFECVTGRRPYRAADPAALGREHRTAPPPVEELPEPVRPLVARGMAKDPAHRPAEAAALAAFLETVATAAYGPDWEERGVRALAVATAALAALVPLGALAAAPAAGAAAGGAGAGLLAGTGAKATLAVVGAVAVAAAGGTAIRATGPEPPAVRVAAVTRTFADPPFRADLGYASVSGLADAAVQRRVNGLLRAPVDEWAAEVHASMRSFPQPGGTASRAGGTQVTVGLTSPKLLSVRYRFLGAPYRTHLGDSVFTVDLVTGRRLGGRDLFRAAALTAAGTGTLTRRLVAAGGGRDLCGNDYQLDRVRPIAPADLTGGPENPTARSAAVEPLLTRDGVVFDLGLPALGYPMVCAGRDITLPYDRLTDLLRPEMIPQND